MKNNNSTKITEDFLSIFKSKLESGESETNIRKFVKEHLGLSKSRGNEVYNEIKQNLEYAENYGLAFVSDKYVYNQNTDTYVINLKCKKSPLCISGAKHRAICRSYSSWIDDLSVNEICVKYSITPEVFAEYRKIFGLTKDREPLSAEEVIENSVDESVKSIVEEKRFKIYQGYEKELWKDTQTKAAKWDRFNTNKLDILKLSLDSWNPPKQTKIKLKPEIENGQIMLVGLFDIHLGEKYDSSKGFAGRDFNSKIACENMIRYAEKIEQAVAVRKNKFASCVVAVGGDFFNSCLDHFTRKGTALHSDLVNEDMFKTGLDALTSFIEHMSRVFNKVHVVVSKGNHDSVVISYAGIAASKYFRFNPNITFEIPEAWASTHVFNNVFVILTHGAHDTLKAGLPPVSLKLKSFVQEMMLARKEDISKYGQRLCVSGHRHSYSQLDLGSFEFFCLGSSVLSDGYCDALNLRNSPRQNVLIIGQDKVEEVLHFYF